jgi:hypothetical protein
MWFNKLTANGAGAPNPFVLSLVSYNIDVTDRVSLGPSFR